MRRHLPHILCLVLAAAIPTQAEPTQAEPTREEAQPTSNEPAPATLGEVLASHGSLFERWAYGTGYNPSVANMRVSRSLQVQADSTDFEDSWLEGPFMTGTWGGLRRDMFKRGIEFSAVHLIDPFWNPTGGSREAMRLYQEFEGYFTFDFERMADFQGASFIVGGRWRGGGQLSTAIGTTGLVEPDAFSGTRGWRLSEMYYRQRFLNDRVELRVGRQLAQNPFGDIPITYVFINTSLNANIDGLLDLFPFGSGNTTWSAFLRTWPMEDIYAQIGVYNNPDGIGAVDTHGIDFGISGDDGILVMAETAWDPSGRTSMLPGSYLIGGYVMTSPRGGALTPGGAQVINYTTGQAASSKWGVYASITQMVYAEPDPNHVQGLSLFGNVNAAPPERNQVPFFLSGGMVYVGPLPHRNSDQLALGVSYTTYSSDFDRYDRALGGAGANNQTVIELTYSYAVTPWLTVQPDVQYLFNPAANGTVPDALVLGCQIAVTF